MSLVKIFSGSASEYLAERICRAYGNPLGKLSHTKFSDGEMTICYDESVRGCDVFLIQSTFPPSDNLMELLLMIDAAKRASAKTITVVMPYFGYARQDRKDQPRVPISSKLVANLLTAAGAQRIVTCDLHAGQIQGFFEFPVDHLYGSAIFVPYLEAQNFGKLVFAAPDVGAMGRARGFSTFFENSEIVVCDKHRKKANEVASMKVIGEVEGADIVILDDLIDTAGTITTAAKVIKENGAKSVRAMVTHPILSGPAYERINDSELQELVVTDSIPLREESPKIKVLPSAELFAKAIRKIHDNESISSLFI
jgi:ribose-phosphate pyrophosphokinase